MKETKRFPSSGGSYKRAANGKLDQIEKPTAPARDKRLVRAEAKAKAAANKTPAKKVTTSEKARG